MMITASIMQMNIRITTRSSEARMYGETMLLRKVLILVMLSSAWNAEPSHVS